MPTSPTRLIRTLSYTLLILCSVLLLASAANAEEPIYTVHYQSGVIVFERSNFRLPDNGTQMTVTGPQDYAYERTFASGQLPEFDTGKLALDGTYNYELRLLSSSAQRNGNSLPGNQNKTILPRQSGVFTLSAGELASPDVDETSTRGGGVVVPTDQIVQGSLCVGMDCVSGETFDIDTIRIKENNTRLRFQDTSNSGSFPSTDWQLTANDSTNGGNNQFSIDDFSAGRQILIVEGGAPDNAVFVDSSGRIGLGTSTPLTDLHTVNGNTPTFRLDQDGSGGFAAQIWDMGGNETEWFVRNTTDFQVPMRIRPAAPTNSLTIGTDGNVGLGTFSPAASLHMQETNVGPSIKHDNIGTNNREWDTGLLDSMGDYTIDDVDTGVTELVVSAGGDVTIAGTLTSTRAPKLPTVNSKNMPSLDEMAQFITSNQQLPGIATENAGQAHDVIAFQMQLLEQIQQLTLHAIEQQQQIDELTRRLEAAANQR